MSEITVLHVEDEEAFAELLSTYLEDIVDADLSIRTTTEPEAALDLLDRSIDCVVCDYDMPGIDGLELLSAVREEYPDLPFVLVTGKGDESVASEAIRRGVTDYLPKPSGSRQYRTLANRIRDAVDRYRSERAAREEADRLRAALDRVDDPVFGVDADWQFTVVNAGARRFLDLPGDPTGTTLREAFPGIEGSGVESALRRANREERTLTVDADLPGVDGPVEVAVYPDDAGEGATVLVRRESH